MDALETILAFTLRDDVEGGFVDDPDDPGGRTNHGITQATYSGWLDTHDMPNGDVRRNADVKQITMQEVHTIYKEVYWCAPKLDLLAEALPATAGALFDFRLNIGHPNEAVKLLQRRCGIVADGAIGPDTCRAATIKAALVGGDLALALQFNQDRRAWYDAHSKPKYIHGLKLRCDHLDVYLRDTFGTPANTANVNAKDDAPANAIPANGQPSPYS